MDQRRIRRRIEREARLDRSVAWLEVALAFGLPEEMQIGTLSRMEHREALLGSKRRDEAHARATQLIALVATHKLPEEKASIRA